MKKVLNTIFKIVKKILYVFSLEFKIERKRNKKIKQKDTNANSSKCVGIEEYTMCKFERRKGNGTGRKSKSRTRDE